MICAIIESESAEQKRNEVTVTTWTKSVSLQFASVRWRLPQNNSAHLKVFPPLFTFCCWFHFYCQKRATHNRTNSQHALCSILESGTYHVRMCTLPAYDRFHGSRKDDMMIDLSKWKDVWIWSFRNMVVNPNVSNRQLRTVYVNDVHDMSEV